MAKNKHSTPIKTRKNNKKQHVKYCKTNVSAIVNDKTRGVLKEMKECLALFFRVIQA